jgi:hypothetical protein
LDGAEPGGESVSPKREFTVGEARRIGDALGIDWAKLSLEEFQAGLGVELEHGARDPQTNVTNDDEILTGKIAFAHLKEFPDYYTRLAQLESEAEAYWANKS